MRLGHAAWWLLAGATADVEVRHALLLAGGVSPLAERWSKIGGGAVVVRQYILYSPGAPGMFAR